MPGITSATLRAHNNYDYYRRRSYSERPTHVILHDYRRDPSCSVSPSSADVSETRSNTRRRRNRPTKNIPKVGMKSHTSAVADMSCGREPQSPRRYRGCRSEHDYAIRRSDVRRGNYGGVQGKPRPSSVVRDRSMAHSRERSHRRSHASAVAEEEHYSPESAPADSGPPLPTSAPNSIDTPEQREREAIRLVLKADGLIHALKDQNRSMLNDLEELTCRNEFLEADHTDLEMERYRLPRIHRRRRHSRRAKNPSRRREDGSPTTGRARDRNNARLPRRKVITDERRALELPHRERLKDSFWHGW